MTPFYERNGITIYCGEASEVMAEWEAGSIDLTVTSPPYDDLRRYLGYTFDFAAIAGQLWRVTTKGGVAVWVVGDETKDGCETGNSFRQVLNFMSLGFNLHDTMIYDKNGFRYPFPDKYHQVFEFMFILSKGRPGSVNLLQDRPIIYNSHSSPRKREANGEMTRRKSYHNESGYGKRFNIWRYSPGGAKSSKDTVAFDHPAIFPEALARDHILSWSNPGDLVADPMLGSGTVAKMAQQLGRRFVGCDISEEYCKIAVDRLRQPSFFSSPAEVQPQGQKAEQAPLW